MSFNIGDRVVVSGSGLGQVVGTLENRPDWYNVRTKGYVCAVHEDRLSYAR